MLLQHRELFTKLQSLSDYDPHAMTEQELLNSALSADKSVKWGKLKESVVADGKRFFIDRETQKRGEWPAVVHNNYIVGTEGKRQRFVNTSLWMLDSEGECKPFPLFNMPRGPREGTEMSLVIKVLAYNRPQALLRLFESLLRVDFLGDHVTIDIYVDGPSDDVTDDVDSLLDRAKVLRMAELFRWPHGHKRVIDRPTNVGLAGQWLNSWHPIGQGELAWFLEDDNVAAEGAYRYIKAAAKHFYFDQSRFDPRLFGIALQAQHVIAGDYPARPRDRLPEGTRFYKYQLLSTWGPVFFPAAWSDFCTWQSEKGKEFKPLFSNLVTNDWYVSRGGKSVWSTWFIRYAAERGMYALYTNYEDGAAFVANYRDKGVNYGEAKGVNSGVVEGFNEGHVDFPGEIPVYDFHFNEIREDTRVLEGRGLYADIFNIETH
mgnify:CR=1 FL=1